MLLKIKKNKLNDKQKANLNIKSEDQLNPEIWCKQISHCYKAPNKLNIIEGDKQNFLKYSKSLEWNDRAKVNTKRNKIVLFQIEPIENKEFNIKQIQKILQVYYPNLDFVIYPDKLKIEKNDSYHQVINQKNPELNFILYHYPQSSRFQTSNLITQMQRKYLNNHKIPIEKYLDLQNSQVFSIMTFIDQKLFNPPSENYITGLTAGYSGSIVSVYEMSEKREIFSTIIHEMGHILHLGHCNIWNCLMNYGYEFGDFSKFGGCFWLCPGCVQKLQFQLNFDILERYKEIQKSGLLLLKEDEIWVDEVIKGIEQNYKEKKQEEMQSDKIQLKKEKISDGKQKQLRSNENDNIQQNNK